MKINDKALDEAVHWYWKHGAISGNVPRGCIETYLKAAKAAEPPVSSTDYGSVASAQNSSSASDAASASRDDNPDAPTKEHPASSGDKLSPVEQQPVDTSDIAHKLEYAFPQISLSALSDIIEYFRPYLRQPEREAVSLEIGANAIAQHRNDDAQWIFQYIDGHCVAVSDKNFSEMAQACAKAWGLQWRRG